MLVPTNESLGFSWTEATFDDSSWITGPTGVGYEFGSGSVVAYANLIGADGSYSFGGALGHDFVVNSTLSSTQRSLLPSWACSTALPMDWRGR